MDKILITPHEKGLNIKVFSDKEVKDIGGHRFVALLGKKPKYENAFTIMLGFLGLKPFQQNVFADIGGEFENKLLDYVWGEGSYKSFEFSDYKGDMFPNVKGFNGLIDGLHKQENKIAEVKCYFNRKKLPQAYFSVKKQRSVRKLIDEFYLQTRLYLWLLNKENPNCGISKAEIITCFFKSTTAPEIEDKYIDIFPIYHRSDDGFDQLIKTAQLHKEQLMKEHIDEDGNRYFECHVLYNAITKNTLTLLEEINKGTAGIDGQKVEIVWNKN